MTLCALLQIHTASSSLWCIHYLPPCTTACLSPLAAAAVILHFSPCHFVRSLASSRDKIKPPWRERAPCEVPVPASPCAKSQEGGWQLAYCPPFYISSVLIFSRSPHLFCQPSSFRETALLNKAWVIYCKHHWTDTTCFSSADWRELEGGCGFGSLLKVKKSVIVYCLLIDKFRNDCSLIMLMTKPWQN